MVNPYKSPEQTVSDDAKFVPRLWPVYQRIFVSISVSVVAGFCVFWAWRFLGHDKSLTANEFRLWLLLASGLVLSSFAFDSLRQKFLNTASVSRYVFGIAGTLLLANIASFFVEIFMAWYSGVEVESFVLSNRMFGDYAWLYWFSAIMVSVLPVAICLHGVSRRRWLIVPVLLVVCLVAVADLRMSYLLNHANHVPSSWSDVFWGV